MKATRSDYRELVEVIKRLEPDRARRIIWASALADVLVKSNPRFSRTLFIDAAGE